MAEKNEILKLDKEESEFVELMGKAAQAEGMPRIAGRIWGALISCDEPVTSDQLARILQISKGSVSSNARLLESLNIIDRGYQLGSRQEYFSMKSRPYQTLIEGQISRIEKSVDFISSTRAKVRKGLIQQKLSELEQFYLLYRSACMKMVDELKDT